MANFMAQDCFNLLILKGLEKFGGDGNPPTCYWGAIGEGVWYRHVCDHQLRHRELCSLADSLDHSVDLGMILLLNLLCMIHGVDKVWRYEPLEDVETYYEEDHGVEAERVRQAEENGEEECRDSDNEG